MQTGLTLQNIESFVDDLETLLNKYFPNCHLKYLIKTPRALKANIQINRDMFIAIRYNSINGRKDFALINKGQRAFGYDNLKIWHVHPFNTPEIHQPCDSEPTMGQIFIEIRNIYENLIKE